MAFSRILVANDDGLHAPGLAALVASLSSSYEVYVVAPDRERSGVGHGFTLFNPLRADAHPERFPAGLAKQVHSCSGLPADCVKMGLIELHKEVGIDLVVSGVNKGANMGIDVHYSGTVAAAREALFNDVPGMGVSLVLRGEGVDNGRAPHFATAADWAVRLIEELEEPLRAGVKEGYFLNVNLANRSAEDIDGWCWTDVADTIYDDGYVTHKDPSGRAHYWLEGQRELRDERSDCDVAVVARGKVSVTPLTVKVGDQAALAKLRKS